jgi:3-phytase
LAFRRHFRDESYDKRTIIGMITSSLLIGCAQNSQPLESKPEESKPTELQRQLQLRIGAQSEFIELPEDEQRENFAYTDRGVVPTVAARFETQPVTSNDDAADDPAIWIHPTDPKKSLILATDKKAGIGVYDLEGNLVQFVPAGLPNNIDLRQGVTVGDWAGDLAVTSNREDNSVTLFSVVETGARIIGSFAADIEPYGICLGRVSGVSADDAIVAFVTYKNGVVKGYQIQSVHPAVKAIQVGSLSFSSQLEGCVHQDKTNRLFVGEEGAGIWQLKTHLSLDGTIDGPSEGIFEAPTQVDSVGELTGLVADVEGVALYDNGEQQYLIASSQGNDSYAVYDAASPYDFRGRFRIGASETSGVDGAQETDGIEANSAAMGERFPLGIFVVQDGFNAPIGTSQNFKVVDWRDIARALELP